MRYFLLETLTPYLLGTLVPVKIKLNLTIPETCLSVSKNDIRH
jgi:hypothetical protein